MFNTDTHIGCIASMMRGDTAPAPRAFLDAVITAELAPFNAVTARYTLDHRLHAEIALEQWDTHKLQRLARWRDVLTGRIDMTVVPEPRSANRMRLTLRAVDEGGIVFVAIAFSRSGDPDAIALLEASQEHNAALLDQVVGLACARLPGPTTATVLTHTRPA